MSMLVVEHPTFGTQVVDFDDYIEPTTAEMINKSNFVAEKEPRPLRQGHMVISTKKKTKAGR